MITYIMSKEKYNFDRITYNARRKNRILISLQNALNLCSFIEFPFLSRDLILWEHPAICACTWWSVHGHKNINQSNSSISPDVLNGISVNSIFDDDQYQNIQIKFVFAFVSWACYMSGSQLEEIKCVHQDHLYPLQQTPGVL